MGSTKCVNLVGSSPRVTRVVKHPLHAGLYRHELRGEHDLVVGNFLQQAHLDERLLERRYRLGVKGAIRAEDGDLLVIGAADNRRAEVEHL